MNIILSPKDNVNKMTLINVATFAQEGVTLLVVFKDGRTRNYPLQHLWYYESNVKNHVVGEKVSKLGTDDEDLSAEFAELID